VEFQRWWVLKNKLFGQESTMPSRKNILKIHTSNDGLSRSAKIVVSKSIEDVKE